MRFDFDFHPSYRWILRPLTVTPDNSFVELTEDTFVAKFGRWTVRTPLTNISGYERSGDYKWYRAIGIRGSLADHGLTFGSTTKHGVCLKFVEPIKAFIPGMPHHPGLTITIADPDRFVAELEALLPDG